MPDQTPNSPEADIDHYRRILRAMADDGADLVHIIVDQARNDPNPVLHSSRGELYNPLEHTAGAYVAVTRAVRRCIFLALSLNTLPKLRTPHPTQPQPTQPPEHPESELNLPIAQAGTIPDTPERHLDDLQSDLHPTTPTRYVMLGLDPSIHAVPAEQARTANERTEHQDPNQTPPHPPRLNQPPPPRRDSG